MVKEKFRLLSTYDKECLPGDKLRVAINPMAKKPIVGEKCQIEIRKHERVVFGKITAVYESLGKFVVEVE